MDALPQDDQLVPSTAASGASGEAGSSSEITCSNVFKPEHFKANGKFAVGNPGGPGRPKLRPFRDAIRKRLAANPEELAEIVNEVFEAAKGLQTNHFGDVVNQLAGFEILRDTTEGRPAQAIELSGGEDEETGEQKSIPVLIIPAGANKI